MDSFKSKIKTKEDMQQNEAQTAIYSDISEKSGYLRILKKPNQYFKL